MGYIVTIARRISEAELRAAVDKDNDLEIGERGEGFITIIYKPDPDIYAVFSNGQIQVTSPDEGLYDKFTALAGHLSAEIVEEDDLLYGNQFDSPAPARSIWLGWPFILTLLLLLLIWRW